MRRAAGNLRAVMTVICFADGLRIVEPETPGQRFDPQVWLRGQKPGDLAGDAQNPCLYRAGE